MPYVKQFNYKNLVARCGKRCPACSRKKEADEFNNNRNRHDGKQAYCRKCQNSGKVLEQRRSYARSEKRKAYVIKWQNENRSRVNEYSRRSRRNKKLRAINARLMQSIALSDRMYAGVV